MIRKILSNFQKNTTLQAVLPGKTLVNLTDIIVNLLKVSIPTKTLKVKGIFEFTLDHDLWKMPGHPTLYIHTTKVEFDKPDKTENKQKNEKNC